MSDHPLIGSRLQQNLHYGQYQWNSSSLPVLSCPTAHKKSECDGCCSTLGAADESNFKFHNCTCGVFLKRAILFFEASLYSIDNGTYIKIQMIRFATSLLGVILVSYTLEIYPSNVRRLGFSVCLGVSSIGSIVMPWLNESFISLDLSGFISFAVASASVIYFVPQLDETYGRMCT
jgi:hypothetical protein